MMKLGGRCIVQKSQPSSNLGSHSLSAHPLKMWRWSTTLEKSAHSV